MKLCSRSVRRVIAVGVASLWLLSAPAWAALDAAVSLAPGQPAIVYPGQTTLLRIALGNTGATALNSVAFASALPGALPNGLSIAGAASYNCTSNATGSPVTSPGAGTLTAIPGSQAVSLASGVIPAKANGVDGVCIIDLPVRAGSATGAATSYTYTLAAGAVTGNDGSAQSNAGSVGQQVQVRSMTPPNVSFSFSASTLVLYGTPSLLRITVHNNSAAPISNFAYVSAFPLVGGTPLIRVADPPSISASCFDGGTPPTVTANVGDSAVAVSGGTVAPNSQCTVALGVVAAHTNNVYQSAASYTMSPAAFSSDTGLVPTVGSANVAARSPSGVSASFSPTIASTGGTGTFSVSLMNVGNVPLTVTSFGNTPIDGIGNAAYGIKVSGTPTMLCGGSGVAGSFARTNDNMGFVQTSPTTLAPNVSCELSVPIVSTSQTATAVSTYTANLAAGSIAFSTSGVVSQAAGATQTVVGALRILKSAMPTVTAAGNPVRYTVTVQNYTASAMTNVTVVDPLANGQTFLAGIIGGVNFDPTLTPACGALGVSSQTGANSASFTIPVLPAGSPGVCVLQFSAMTSPTATTATNQLAVGSVCAGGGSPCNGTASPTTAVTSQTTFLAGRTLGSPGPVDLGTAVTVTVNVNNLSARPLTAVSVTDALPAGPGTAQMRLADPVNFSTTCSNASVTAQPGATTLSVSNATVPAMNASTGLAGSCSFRYDVTATAGTYSGAATTLVTVTYANGTTAQLPAYVASSPAITFRGTLNFDASGGSTRYEAASDGLLLMRYLFGVRGAALTTGALAGDAQRTDAGQVADYLAAMGATLDIDGNGAIEATTDGVLVLRYLLGLRGSALIQGAVAGNATRTTSNAIEAWISSLAP